MYLQEHPATVTHPVIRVITLPFRAATVLQFQTVILTSTTQAVAPAHPIHIQEVVVPVVVHEEVQEAVEIEDNISISKFLISN
jgi:hypothetical protein